ncbi:hypothetical protein [Flavobacterium piscis]|uniref:Lipoprotein n=1 Tax=Flavobacterium piscis TaxID=1114874 RepID=A0ABU1YB43_9FLAO|nr:hypothetical protein [Flavobacterium piscis]MDR7211462.1 hypothetical protein [Flavobacterium piscis]
MRKIILYLLVLFFASSCVTRLESPLMQGYIYDSNKTPLEEVQVCLNEECILTNKKGYFNFKRKTYIEFVRIGGEAPPLIYNLSISKKTYKDTIISYRSLYGGADVDLEIEYNNIVLKPKAEK